jgi:tRNA 2-(methylsulfanyl)-N6-isopentenyladenosine37 hydroxylase
MDHAVTEEIMADIHRFLKCPTPQGWIDVALENMPILLIDHANCEKKAASTAMSMMYKYIDRKELLLKMSKLAREELVHFDQVTKIMYERDIEYVHVSAARYAQGLHSHVRKQEPDMLIDKCIIGSIVEARSCERFAALIPYLDDELGKFYFSLLRSEGRHYRDYLTLAELYAEKDISDRVEHFLTVERELIESPDNEFRFHSGVPVAA